MKQFLFMAGLTTLFVGIQSLMYCAKPLEGTLDGPNPFPSDTVFVSDTIFQTDTLVIFDSLGQTDTVIIVDTIVQVDTMVVVDTVTIVDTVIIIEPDTTGTRMLCARLSNHRHEIVWIFSNHQGLYGLDFSSVVDKDHPLKTLLVDIDGQTVEWFPIENMELTVELILSEDFVIRITPQKPLSRGHTIDICLTLRKL